MKKYLKKWWVWAAIVVVSLLIYYFFFYWSENDRKRAALLLAWLDVNKYGGTAAENTESGLNSIAKGYYEGTHPKEWYGWLAFQGGATKTAKVADLKKLKTDNKEGWDAISKMQITF